MIKISTSGDHTIAWRVAHQNNVRFSFYVIMRMITKSRTINYITYSRMTNASLVVFFFLTFRTFYSKFEIHCLKFLFIICVCTWNANVRSRFICRWTPGRLYAGELRVDCMPVNSGCTEYNTAVCCTAHCNNIISDTLFRESPFVIVYKYFM